MKKICKNCKWWNKGGYTTDFKKDWGFCTNPKEEIQESVASPMEDFGCIHFKEKE